MMEMSIDQEVQQAMAAHEVCPFEYLCAQHRCSDFVYSNFEDCARYSRIQIAMRRDHHGHYYEKRQRTKQVKE